MATGNARKPGTSATRKKTSSGSNKRNRAAVSDPPMDGTIKKEIYIIGILAVAVFLFLCNFSIMGVVGDFVSDIMFGIFGLLAYITPVFIFLITTFGISNHGSFIAGRKIAAGVVLYLLVGIVCELWVAGLTEASVYDLQAIYHRCAENHHGGGVISGSLAFLSHHLLGNVGTVLAVIVLGLISVVVITERSFMSGVREGGQRVYQRSREDAAARKERNRQRREEQEEEKKRREEEAENEKILRMDKKVTGVMMNTVLAKESGGHSGPGGPADKIRDDMHEITLEDFEEQLTSELDFSKIRIHGNFDHEDNEDTAYGSQDIHNANELHEISRPLEQDKPAHESASGKQHPIHKGQDTADKSEAGRDPSADIAAQLNRAGQKRIKKYVLPPVSKLRSGTVKGKGDQTRELKETALRLQQTLKTFGVGVTITDISQGPAVTRYELQPEQGIKVSRIVSLADDIKLNLAATDIRIEAPIPGKAAVGIEVPNKENTTVAFRDLIESKEFRDFPSNLAFAAGKDIAGQIVVADIARMPHMLIAGATGSGKSVCINTLIMSILYKADPEEVKLIMIDPKVVELSVYNGIPHLLVPVVTDPKKASAALHWGVAEMTERYQKFADYNVRDLKGFNKKAENLQENGDPEAPEKMPQIVIIVDELADLMMVAPGEVEESICRLAQLARAAGIHLIIATQRPSVDVITGLIKANMPSRVAFSVSSGVDSRTILDMNGAEKLLGKGDMLFYPQGYAKPARIQGAFISDKEVSDVVTFIKNQMIGNVYSEAVEEKITSLGAAGSSSSPGASGNERDPFFVEAGKFIIDKDKASIGNLQRVFKIGFNRAARIMDQLCEAGVVGEEEGTKPRKVLMSGAEFERYIEET